MKFKTFELNVYKSAAGITLSFDKKDRALGIIKSKLFHLDSKHPLKLKITNNQVERYRIKQQAKRDLKAFYNKDTLEPLFNESLAQSTAKKSNGKNTYWISLELYWAGYARGIREHRQKVKETTQSAFDIIGADDVTELSHELGVSEDKLTYAVLEVISKRKNGGKA